MSFNVDDSPDVIFEQNNISKIIEIHKKLQDEIEKKKEELRFMVGERYRDLIMAADTIATMKNTSTSIVNHIQNITESCINLNDQQLMGFKTEIDHTDKINRNANNKFYSTVVQVKLLTILPELIWTSIDDENFFIATQLFIFSRHISTGLQFDSNNIVIKKLPVAKKQWDILSSFFFTIKQACLETLEREDLTTEATSKCLASFMLLEQCPIEKVLSTLIQLRGKAYLNSLSENEFVHIKVKDKILTSLKILNQTVILLYECFIDNGTGEGQLLSELKELTGNNSKPTISFLESEMDSVMIGILPDIISKFKPLVTVTPLKSDIIKATVNSWLQYIEIVSKNQLKLLIDLITSVKTIQDIRIQAQKLYKPENWIMICEKLSLPNNLDLYQFCYQPLVFQCVQNIVKNSWQKSLEQINVDVEKLLTTNEKNFKDFKSFIWTEEQSDNPRSLKDALSQSKQSHKLLMKTKGYVPSIVLLCDFIDKQMELLFNDFNLYLNTNDSDVLLKKAEDDENLKEKTIMIEFFRTTSLEGVTELITKIKSLKFKETSANYIYLARLLQAISELCPNLKMCLSQNMLSSKWDFNQQQNQSEYWDNIFKLLEDESLRFWKLWMTEFKINSVLYDNVDLNMLLKEFPNWEIITIEEKDEQDNIIQSSIRVPSQPSFFLQEYLHSICGELNQIVPHTLPKSVTILLDDKIISELYLYYRKLSDNEFVKTNQNTSLQYYFDVKFISLVLVSRENKQLAENIQTVSNIYKSYVDPFDFELFFKYLNLNVKKSGQRMQHQLGCIISNNEQLTAILGNQIVTSQEKEPNILSLSSNATTTFYFPLLPIVTNKTTDTEMHKYQPMKTKKSSENKMTTSTSSISTSTPSSSSALAATQNYAAAFFGAMSNEWFRSN